MSSLFDLIHTNARALWKRYAAALALIAGCLIISHTIQGWSLSRAMDDAVWVNESGFQRANSVRVLYRSSVQIQDPSAAHAEALLEVINGMERGHARLAQMPGMSERLSAHYFQPGADDSPSLDAMVQRYLKNARRVAKGSPDEAAAAFREIEAAGPTKLLSKLDEAVTILEQESRAKNAASGAIQSWSLWGAMLLLVLEAVVIFYPAQRSAVMTIGALEATNQKLLQKSKEYRAANEKLLNVMQQSSHDARHDALTQLPNRRYLAEVLDERIETARLTSSAITAMHVDLDRFKQINDTLGHAAGDFILCHVAGLLKAQALPGSFIARVGGDEFVILAPQDASTEALVDNADHLIAQLREPVDYNGAPCFFGASIGIGIASADAASGEIDRLLEDADIALYRAKEQGRGRVEVFSKAIKQEFEETKQMSDALLVALAEDQITPDYQLQFSAQTKEVVGAEALARWHRPGQGKLAPSAFFDIAVTMNLVPRLDQSILEKTKAHLALFDAFEKPIDRIAINLSAQRLDEADFFAQVQSIGIDPARFCFELTETIRLESVSSVAKANIAALQEAGFDLEIDDFGTGHASILSLLNLKPKRVKIARELIVPLETVPGHDRFLRQLIELAKSMELEVICEGVESLEVGEELAHMGCDIIQGFAYAKPVSPGRLIEMLQSLDRPSGKTPIAARDVMLLAA